MDSIQLPTYQAIAEDIGRRIRRGEYAAGERLMSIGEFCTHYQVSVATAHRSISTLASRGLVRTIPRKGVYVAGVPSPPAVEQTTQVERIIVVESVLQRKRSTTKSQAFSQGIVESIVEASRLHHIPLRFEYIPVDPAVGPRVYFTPEAGDGIIAVGGGVSLALVSHLITPNVQSVLVDAALPNAHCVLTDNYAGMQQVIELLHRYGHRRIVLASCFAASGANPTNENERRDAALHHAELAGLHATMIDSGDWEDLFAALRGPGKHTAIVFTRDLSAGEFLKIARGRGLRVPHDVSVVGFDGWAKDEALLAELTTVRVDRTSLGRTAVEMVVNPPKRGSQFYEWRRVKPRLVPGATVAKLIGKTER